MHATPSAAASWGRRPAAAVGWRATRIAQGDTVQDAPTIVVTGMCNTKGAEIRYLAEQVAEHGGEPIIMDLSLGAAVDWADVSLHDVLAATGTPIEEVFAAPRATAIDLVGPCRRRQDPRAPCGRPVRRHHLVGRVGRDDDGDPGDARAAVRCAQGDAHRHGVQRRQHVARQQGHLHRQPDRRAGDQRRDSQAVANAAAAVVAMARVPESRPGSRAAVRDHLVRLDDADRAPLQRRSWSSGAGM